MSRSLSFSMDAILISHIVCCFLMTGVIWVIQLVHYPSFKYVDEKKFADFAKFHASRISWIVLPLMLVEFMSAFYLLDLHSWAIYNLSGVVMIWLSTFFLSVPCHNKLQKGKDNSQINRLVFTNWPRTILWSMRSACFTWFLLQS